MPPHSPVLTKGLSLILAICCGFSVATIYYNQAMLPLIAGTFEVSTAHVGQIAMLTQLGYACGLLLFVPLGDRISRRTLILAVLCINFVSLLASATAPSYTWLLMASVLLGLSGISAQVIIPAASDLSEPVQKGAVLGLMVSGLSAGGLLARTVSGVFSGWLGWRGMFAVAAALDVLLFLAILTRMPVSVSTSRLPYGALLKSLWGLARQHATLRQSAIKGGLVFGALNVFWGSMAALLALPPYGFSSAQAGLLGLSAIVGILCASTIGQQTRRHGQLLEWIGIGTVLVAFLLIFTLGPQGWWWPILIAATFLDLGNRINQLANQTRVLALEPAATSRLNTVFMVIYFIGGALGSASGAFASEHYGWQGQALTGAAFAGLALLITLLSATTRKSTPT
ncbi:MFS transporter [Pseudomonas sp. CHM02]|uniref:MFS transporter n=1 Tax=Pseudomonas sp. CHM02 TaxID=1463662 RepID=UPI000472AC88|nr:MFS transporter [Pseudomonas sp. CHM02]